MKLPRKLKKRVIKSFGLGTYRGIIKGYLAVIPNDSGRGCRTFYTDKYREHGHKKCVLFEGQYNPYISFPKIICK